ncbi:MAG: hypothetical protein K9N52_06030 [Verrucomicrobia bacterium]|nr:hypothetical protein [Verrucomicrobiota bacterium]
MSKLNNKLRIIGEHPLKTNEDGVLFSRIGTIFVSDKVLVTLRGIHAQQRLHYVDYINDRRKGAGKGALTEAEEEELFNTSVDLIFEPGQVLIRPDPANMELAFQADEILQSLVSKTQIKFLHTRNETVRDAIRRWGELWRIAPLPKSPEEMEATIASSRTAIEEGEIYYYNKNTGTRYLTFDEFAGLADKGTAALRRQLEEIKVYSAKENHQNEPELAFFPSDAEFGHSDFEPYDFANIPATELRKVYNRLKSKFAVSVPVELRFDDLKTAEWRRIMLEHLVADKCEVDSEETELGLGSEFFLQIEWLPGGRIEFGELIFDSVYDEDDDDPNVSCNLLCDPKVKGFIFNFIREFGDLEWVNIGRVARSLSRRPKSPGRRGVYVADLKPSSSEKRIIRIIRLQKECVRENLDKNMPLLDAILAADKYTEYILNRRHACRQLGMNMPQRIGIGRVREQYDGLNDSYRGISLWATYFERDYLFGEATDKIPGIKYENREFASKFARLLGRAAAPNMILGRMDADGNVLFDDGDEVLIFQEDGLPKEIVVSDLTGAFSDYSLPLEKLAAEYARPVKKRIDFIRNKAEFIRQYVIGFHSRFAEIQSEYRRRRRAFDCLFKHLDNTYDGGLSERWARVLNRLDHTDSSIVAMRIQHNCEVVKMKT